MSIRNLITGWMLDLLVCFFVVNLAAGRVIYVDDDAAGANNGSSWKDAYVYLQDALAVARSGDEIRVAQGIYRPDQGVGIARGDRDATFQLRNDIAIVGGYAGFGEPNPDARDVRRYETILSGDLAGDDVDVKDPYDLLWEVTRTENSFHIITARETDVTATLDGFTITSGNAVNSIDGDGGGMLCEYGDPKVVCCRFIENCANLGGGLSARSASLEIVDCTFIGNHAIKSGGAIHASEGCPVLISCRLIGNWAQYTGGGMHSWNNNTTIINCAFSGNYAQEGGGLIAGSATIVMNSTFSRNHGADFTGGIRSYGKLTIANSILWGNTDANGSDESAQLKHDEHAVPVVDHCCLQGWTDTLGGTGNHGEDPLFVDADGADNTAGTEDDNLRLLRGSPCIDAGVNSAIPEGLLTDLDGNARIINGTVDLGAYEGEGHGIMLSAESVAVPEGATATFTVSLAMDPRRTVRITVAVESGDSDLSVESGNLLIFDSSNYWHPQTVTLVATPDIDCLHGSAVISVSAAGLPTLHILAEEIDDEICEVLHVDKRASGTGDGTSWQNAFADLQEALKLAVTMRTVKEVRVAQGTYRPAGPFGDRAATFQLVNGVAIRGGYAGLGEDNPDARDKDAYPTVLSGDLNGDDVTPEDPVDLLTEPSRADNSYHVVTASHTDAATVLDGFIITGGASEVGIGNDRAIAGGMLIRWSNQTVSNCTFTRNFARGSGGGFCANLISRPTFVNCTLKENVSGSSGGGISVGGIGALTLINCVFVRNAAGLCGGGMDYRASNDASLINCIFIGNSAEYGGGICTRGHSCLTNCTFSGNVADEGGATLFWGDSPAALTNCIIWDNVAWKGSQIVIDGATVTTSHSAIQYRQAGIHIESGTLVWGLGNIDKNPRFVDADGLDNIIGTEDDDLKLNASSPCIDAGDNEADADGSAPGVQLLPGVDADLNVRRFDDPLTTDTGLGKSPIVDMGAYEFGSPPIPSILYVNDDADGANTGISWEDAFTNLQMALQTAFLACGKVSEIWAAAGTYKPVANTGDRSATFHLINDLAIYGGFAGIENRLAQRNVTTNVTILSGDLDNNDVQDHFGHKYSNIGDNSYHVVTGSYTNSSAILDGFTISGGNANFSDGINDRGAGLYVISGSPQIRNCLITQNSAEKGGGVYCERSSPTLADCSITGNAATEYGGGFSCLLSTPTLADCMFSGNSPGGMWIEKSSAWIIGNVQMAYDNCVGVEAILEGEGTLQIESDVSLVFDNSRVRCNVTGPGILKVSSGSELIIESKAEIDLSHEVESNGRILCDGLLRVKDNAIISNAQVTVTRASFEDNAIVANCVISAEAGAPYGQFYIEDNVQIWLDGIEADGDRYLDLDPSEFDCNNIHIDAIDVNITEGKRGNYGGLFEARGRDLENPPCDSSKFFCQVDTVPDFDPNTWTLNQLELAPGSKVNITNRFDFQAPYDSGGDEEVLYVKQLILGPGSILNTAFNRIYYETLIMDPTAKIMNIPLLGFSLNNIGFNDENEFLTRIKHNNFEHSEDPAYNRLHVERVEGFEPDPNGMMQMCNLLDLNPESSSYQQVISARAEGLFAKAIETKILIEFEYLFSTSEPSLELVVYLTDVPELLEHNDPDRQDHYIKVAHLKVPPTGRPGSPGSGRFGVFHKYVERGKLDFMKGTRIEFELVGPAGACVYIDNWDPQIHCNDLYCGDVTGDHGATVLDYLTVVASVGSPAGLLPDGSSTACLEFGFGVDGRVDTLDVSAWAWMLSREELPNLCDIFLTPGMVTLDAHVDTLGTTKNPPLQSSLPTVYPLDALLITGKSGESDDSSKLEDNLYVFDDEGQYIRKFKPESDCTNGKLVRDESGEIYQVNHEKGLIRLSDGLCVIPPATFIVDTEPRNGSNATISIGLHSEYISYDDEPVAVWVGHPILDAAFDAEGYAYVTPVVINPDRSEPYQAVARLQLLNEENPPYRIVQLYDDPPAPNDNKDQNNLREIEVSDSGNLYVINTGNLNESDILWVYDIDTGQVIDHAELSNPYGDCFLQAPVAMHISNTRDMLYIASSQNDPNSICTSVYALSESDLSIVATTVVNGMGHITDITEDPITDTLWIVGFTMSEIPDYLESNVEAFYKPYIAQIPYESSEVVEAMCLSDPVLYTDNDLALPLSVIWTGTEEKTINFTHTAANQYRLMSASPDFWSDADFNGESHVTFNNMLVFCDKWLRENP